MSSIFARFRLTIRFRSKLIGGVPKDPKIIEGWLRTKAAITDETELRMQLERTVRELRGDEAGIEGMSLEELVKASEEVAGERSTTGFKRDEHGLYIEGRQIKAALKESTNVLYAKDKWGPTRKGPRSYLAERLFVEEEIVPLGKADIDGIELFIGHVTGPKGPQSTLGYHEYVERPTCSFTLMMLKDAVFAGEQLDVILEHAQENGIGALRSQGHGRYDVIDVEPLEDRESTGWFSKVFPKLRKVEGDVA